MLSGFLTPAANQIGFMSAKAFPNDIPWADFWRNDLFTQTVYPSSGNFPFGADRKLNLNL
jgi:hypothetical protein